MEKSIMKKIPETNSLAPFFNASILNICLWIICNTDETDVELLNKQDRYTLIEYVSHVQHFKGFELTPMPFERWYDSDRDDIKNYEKEQENLIQ